MIDTREKLRMLYLVSIFQPIEVKKLRTLYLGANKELPFAGILKTLREELYVSDADPLTCTVNGQAVIQSLPIRKGRDIARMFSLKQWAEGEKITATSDG